MLTNRKRTLLLTLMCLVLTFALVAAKVPGAGQGGRTFRTTLTGAAEVPGPGDPDGSGTALITLNPGQGLVCWQISVSNLALPAIGAHIHVGVAGDFGDVVVTLSPPDASGESSGCTTVDQDLIKAILQNPSQYYVNVHTTEYPAGAIRGQLSK